MIARSLSSEVQERRMTVTAKRKPRVQKTLSRLSFSQERRLGRDTPASITGASQPRLRISSGKMMGVLRGPAFFVRRTLARDCSTAQLCHCLTNYFRRVVLSSRAAIGQRGISQSSGTLVSRRKHGIAMSDHRRASSTPTAVETGCARKNTGSRR